jgi:hypothetical protein
MRNKLARTLALAALALTAAGKPAVDREVMAAIEKRFDRRIESFSIDDPFYLLGTTRGFYLAGYGVVFTAELNLVAAAVVTPFRPAFSKQQIESLRQKKMARVVELKKMMRDTLVDSATTLKEVPPDQWVVVGVTLFYYGWEDKTGLPNQILMQAKRQALLDFEAGRIGGAGLEAAIQLEEF